MSTGSRAALATLLAAASLLCGYLVLLLWTEETPGWWFSLLFTVMLVGLVLALWDVYLAAIRDGKERAWAQSRWHEVLADVQLFSGTVVARDVEILEEGSLSSFELTISSPTAADVQAVWRPQASSTRRLLHSQVPGMGASVRLWRSVNLPTDYPLVIEVLDPSVVPGSDDSAVPKYV